MQILILEVLSRQQRQERQQRQHSQRKRHRHYGKRIKAERKFLPSGALLNVEFSMTASVVSTLAP